jgi:hypothetical protein
MDAVDFRIRSALADHWESVVANIQDLRSSVDVRPTNILDSLISFEPNDITSNFDLRPVVVVVPERATHSDMSLHVVLAGKLCIDKAHFRQHRSLRTRRFGTQVAYFRLKESAKKLQHVYGAHYDYDVDVLGHPVFHSQVKDFPAYKSEIQGHEDLELDNFVGGVLQRVRVPTAQMDVFSLLLQIVADHLLSASAGELERASFAKLIETSRKLQGAGCTVDRLGRAPAIECYRALHWYQPA